MSFISFGSIRSEIAEQPETCSSCHNEISQGSETYLDEGMRTIYHRACVESTPAYQEWADLDPDEGYSDTEVWALSTGSDSPRRARRSRTREDFSNQVEGRPDGFWARNKGKIILGAALVAGVAVLGPMVLNAYNENWHQYCLHSLENAKDLWCCTKQVTADAATCLFKRLEPGNFWTDAGDLERLSLEELPKHSAEAYIRNTWAVTGAQKLFKSIFG